jgi:hypothetical protein
MRVVYIMILAFLYFNHYSTPLSYVLKHLKSNCWGLVLKCFELRTRQHKILNVNALHPSKHYLPKGIMNFRRRS